jgi:hypothetical protein
VTAALSHQVTLTERELQTFVRLGIHDLPVVLAVRPAVPRSMVATQRPTMARELVSRKLIVDDRAPRSRFRAAGAAATDRELAMRLVTPDGTARISAVRRGSRGVLAHRIGDDISHFGRSEKAAECTTWQGHYWPNCRSQTG